MIICGGGSNLRSARAFTRGADLARGSAAIFNLAGCTIAAIALVLSLATNLWAQNPGALVPPYPTNLEPDITPASPTKTYDYDLPNSCTGCHFIRGYDFLADVVGVTWNTDTLMWARTGTGWLDSRHAQSEYGENNNTFCTRCHSPLQASATSSFNNGFTQAEPVPDGAFAAVTCRVCHLTHSPVNSVFSAQNPTANGTLAVYKWKGVNNPASFQPVMEGQEDLLCLNCHEQRHSTDNAAFEAMYSVGVRCMDCHMAPYQLFRTLPERHHDWKVAQNEPFSCGAQGSLSGFGCHQEFSGQSAQQFIPFLMQQHSEWWQLPPFTGNTVPVPGGGSAALDAASAHSLNTAGDYRNLWNQIQQADAGH